VIRSAAKVANAAAPITARATTLSRGWLGYAGRLTVFGRRVLTTTRLGLWLDDNP